MLVLSSILSSPRASRRPSRQSSRQVSRRTSRAPSPSSADRQRRSMSAGIATSIRSLGPKSKPTIEIKLTDDQQDDFMPTYTSLDEIKGEVSITAHNSMQFTGLYVTFEGFAKTYVEKVATTSPTNGRTEAFALFLRLTNPNDPSLIPEPRILEAQKTYTFPFVFVVPNQLLPQSCPHPKNEHFPEDGHLALPPSMGDPMAAGSGKQCLDDMAPDMSVISYALKCRLTGPRAASGKLTVLVEGTKKLRIVPAIPESPPLDVRGGDFDDYRLQISKRIKRGFLRKKLGHISMESAQPKSLRLPSPGSESDSNISTTATVNVRFDPHDHSSQPPRLQSMATKLKIDTFYASQPLRDIPNKAIDFHFSSVKGVFTDSVNLAHRCTQDTKWEKHDPESRKPASRPRDSGYSFTGTDTPQPSEGYNPKLPYHTARVIVPVSLPKDNRVFLPSFHSCLISRVYTLHLYLSFLTPQTSVVDPTLHLKLPIQISVESKDPAQQAMTAQEATAILSQQTNEFFEPRSIAPPPPQWTSSSSSILTPSRTPRLSFSTPLRTSIDEDPARRPSNNNTTTTTTNDPTPIAEDTEGEAAAHHTNSDDDIPPSPGPGWSHRPSTTPTPPHTYLPLPDSPPLNQPPPQQQQQQQRFQSLSFENEEAAAMRTLRGASASASAASVAPPPDYEGIAGMYRGYRPRVSASTAGAGGGTTSTGRGVGAGAAAAVAPSAEAAETGVQRVDARRWRDLTGVRVRRR